MMHITEDTPPDMLAGAMDLTVHLPNGKSVKMSVERSTPMMDVLVQITTAQHLQLSGHTIQALGMPPSSQCNDRVLPYKPNTPIGTLDTQHIRVLPKGRSLPVPKNVPPGHQPFESTFRLRVHLPRNQLYVSRVSMNVRLEEIMAEVCDEKNLDPAKYEFRHPANLDEVLDPKLTLNHYQITEIYFVSKGSARLSQAFSASDIMALRKDDERKQSKSGGVFNFFKRGKTSNGSGSLSSDNRSISPTHSDDSRSVTPPAVQQQIIGKEAHVEKPKPPLRKRRPAPKPPQIQDEQKPESKPKKTESGLTICHSRNSSDSSGYHEASILSDNANTSLPRRPQTMIIGENEGRKLNGEHSKSTSNLTTMFSKSKSTSSLAFAGRKKKAPPPPPGLKSASSVTNLQKASPVVASPVEQPGKSLTSHAKSSFSKTKHKTTKSLNNFHPESRFQVLDIYASGSDRETYGRRASVSGTFSREETDGHKLRGHRPDGYRPSVSSTFSGGETAGHRSSVSGTFLGEETDGYRPSVSGTFSKEETECRRASVSLIKCIFDSKHISQEETDDDMNRFKNASVKRKFSMKKSKSVDQPISYEEDIVNREEEDKEAHLFRKFHNSLTRKWSKKFENTLEAERAIPPKTLHLSKSLDDVDNPQEKSLRFNKFNLYKKNKPIDRAISMVNDMPSPTNSYQSFVDPDINDYPNVNLKSETSKAEKDFEEKKYDDSKEVGKQTSFLGLMRKTKTVKIGEGQLKDYSVIVKYPTRDNLNSSCNVRGKKKWFSKKESKSVHAESQEDSVEEFEMEDGMENIDEAIFKAKYFEEENLRFQSVDQIDDDENAETFQKSFSLGKSLSNLDKPEKSKKSNIPRRKSRSSSDIVEEHLKYIKDNVKNKKKENLKARRLHIFAGRKSKSSTEIENDQAEVEAGGGSVAGMKKHFTRPRTLSFKSKVRDQDVFQSTEQLSKQKSFFRRKSKSSSELEEHFNEITSKKRRNILSREKSLSLRSKKNPVNDESSKEQTFSFFKKKSQSFQSIDVASVSAANLEESRQENKKGWFGSVKSHSVLEVSKNPSGYSPETRGRICTPQYVSPNNSLVSEKGVNPKRKDVKSKNKGLFSRAKSQSKRVFTPPDSPVNANSFTKISTPPEYHSDVELRQKPSKYSPVKSRSMFTRNKSQSGRYFSPNSSPEKEKHFGVRKRGAKEMPKSEAIFTPSSSPVNASPIKKMCTPPEYHSDFEWSRNTSEDSPIKRSSFRRDRSQSKYSSSNDSPEDTKRVKSKKKGLFSKKKPQSKEMLTPLDSPVNESPTKRMSTPPEYHSDVELSQNPSEHSKNKSRSIFRQQSKQSSSPNNSPLKGKHVKAKQKSLFSREGSQSKPNLTPPDSPVNGAQTNKDCTSADFLVHKSKGGQGEKKGFLTRTLSKRSFFRKSKQSLSEEIAEDIPQEFCEMNASFSGEVQSLGSVDVRTKEGAISKYREYVLFRKNVFSSVPEKLEQKKKLLSRKNSETESKENLDSVSSEPDISNKNKVEVKKSLFLRKNSAKKIKNEEVNEGNVHGNYVGDKKTNLEKKEEMCDIGTNVFSSVPEKLEQKKKSLSRKSSGTKSKEKIVSINSEPNISNKNKVEVKKSLFLRKNSVKKMKHEEMNEGNVHGKHIGDKRKELETKEESCDIGGSKTGLFSRKTSKKDKPKVDVDKNLEEVEGKETKCSRKDSGRRSNVRNDIEDKKKSLFSRNSTKRQKSEDGVVADAENVKDKMSRKDSKKQRGEEKNAGDNTENALEIINKEEKNVLPRKGSKKNAEEGDLNIGKKKKKISFSKSADSEEEINIIDLGNEAQSDFNMQDCKKDDVKKARKFEENVHKRQLEEEIKGKKRGMFYRKDSQSKKDISAMGKSEELDDKNVSVTEVGEDFKSKRNNIFSRRNSKKESVGERSSDIECNLNRVSKKSMVCKNRGSCKEECNSEENKSEEKKEKKKGVFTRTFSFKNSKDLKSELASFEAKFSENQEGFIDNERRFREPCIIAAEASKQIRPEGVVTSKSVEYVEGGKIELNKKGKLFSRDSFKSKTKVTKQNENSTEKIEDVIKNQESVISSLTPERRSVQKEVESALVNVIEAGEILVERSVVSDIKLLREEYFKDFLTEGKAVEGPTIFKVNEELGTSKASPVSVKKSYSKFETENIFKREFGNFDTFSEKMKISDVDEIAKIDVIFETEILNAKNYKKENLQRECKSDLLLYQTPTPSTRNIEILHKPKIVDKEEKNIQNIGYLHKNARSVEKCNMYAEEEDFSFTEKSSHKTAKNTPQTEVAVSEITNNLPESIKPVEGHKSPPKHTNDDFPFLDKAHQPKVKFKDNEDKQAREIFGVRLRHVETPKFSERGLSLEKPRVLEKKIVKANKLSEVKHKAFFDAPNYAKYSMGRVTKNQKPLQHFKERKSDDNEIVQILNMNKTDDTKSEFPEAGPKVHEMILQNLPMKIKLQDKDLEGGDKIAPNNQNLNQNISQISKNVAVVKSQIQIGNVKIGVATEEKEVFL